MGGRGSGQRASSHNTVDHCYILDASRWMRAGILYQYEAFKPAGVWPWVLVSGKLRREFSIRYQVDTTGPDATARLMYSLEEANGPLDYVIRLQTTTPFHGALRWWFTCPLFLDGKACGRRVQKLYLPPGGRYFGCRHCYRLAYDSRNKCAKTRARKKTQRIRMRLGGNGSLYEPFPEKPPRMWWRTYRKLQLQAEQAEHKYWALR
jgi:hypothetical protein